MDSSEFQNKSTNLGRQYWLERGSLVIKGVMDFSSKDSAPKSHEEIIRQFATSTLEAYRYEKVSGFHRSGKSQRFLLKILEKVTLLEFKRKFSIFLSICLPHKFIYFHNKILNSLQ